MDTSKISSSRAIPLGYLFICSFGKLLISSFYLCVSDLMSVFEQNFTHIDLVFTSFQKEPREYTSKTELIKKKKNYWPFSVNLGLLYLMNQVLIPLEPTRFSLPQ